jgi:hypothetical protein
MNKAWKTALAIATLIVLAIGMLAGDGIRRAKNALELRGERLRDEIASLRAQPHSVDLLRTITLDSGAMKDLSPEARKMAASSDHRLHYEQGLFDQYKFLHGPPLALGSVFNSRKESWTPATVIAVLNISQEAFREGGYEACLFRQYHELTALKHWKDLLCNTPGDPSELRRVHDALGQLLATRPTVEEVHRGEILLLKICLLNVLRNRQDGEGLFRRGPCWREFYSWRILMVKALDQLDDAEGGAGDPHLRGGFRLEDEDIKEVTVLDQWKLARIATAIALYRADKGADVATLQDLVPGFLPELPKVGADSLPPVIELFRHRLPDDEASNSQSWPVLRGTK